MLLIAVGVIIGCIGTAVQLVIEQLYQIKFGIANGFMSTNNKASAFFSYLAFALFFALLASLLCVIEPYAAGSGIPEVKAYLNGVNLNKAMRWRVLFTKSIGMCFSVASGLPLGKEGPMIHTGSIVGAAVSQGKSMTFGFDTSWTKFQDLRNDRNKRDFVTYGAAAGVAAAFRSPIGGILFTLEEGASFWSLSITFRSFFCALMTVLTISLIFVGEQAGENISVGVQFGYFATADYRLYELLLFTLIGVGGGIMGSCFNSINKRVNRYRMDHIKAHTYRVGEVMLLTLAYSLISFLLPLCWRICTPKPIATASFTAQEYELLNGLVQFQCQSGEYNQLASLFFTNSDTAMQLLFHYTSPYGNNYTTFSTGALLVFFIPYILMAAIVSGTLVPAGLFVPTLLSGAAYGRLIGNILNLCFPGSIASPGTYALMGAAAVLGGVARMTIAGTVILVEACGSTSYMLPLMLTFAAARYSGNVFNDSIYEILIHMKGLPFLEYSLKTLGFLNYRPVSEIMARPAVVINEISKVSSVYELLRTTKHNGYPVLNKDGHVRGFILRKVLVTLLKFKTFSFPITPVTEDINNKGDDKVVQLSSGSTIFLDSIERNYPHYFNIEDIQLISSEFDAFLDVRPYMDTSPYTTHESSSVQRVYRYFRTMGLRHLVVLNENHIVTGIITRKDLTEERLEKFWRQEGNNMQKSANADPESESAEWKESQTICLSDYPDERIMEPLRQSILSAGLGQESKDEMRVSELSEGGYGRSDASSHYVSPTYKATGRDSTVGGVPSNDSLVNAELGVSSHSSIGLLDNSTTPVSSALGRPPASGASANTRENARAEREPKTVRKSNL